MTQSIYNIVNDVFGYSTFRQHQEAVIRATLAGEDTFVLLPTGGGKSLCYQIPALMHDGVTLVVSPLIALMHNQVSALEQLGIAAACLNSTLAPDAQQAIFTKLDAGDLRLLYIAPERLVQDYTLTRLKQANVSLIAIDEAHCVSQWGHDFREDYLALGMLADHFPDTPRMALTATATASARNDITERLRLQEPRHFVASFDRPNIRYLVQAKTNARRQLLAFLQTHRGNAGIVYCLSRKKTESIAAWLQTQGFDALPYHAGLDASTRADHQRRFLNEERVIIVATIAFGMGIDKPDVRFIAHLDLPKSLESYYQETGRAGRDGLAAEAWMVYGLQDVVRLRQMVDASTASEAHKRNERARLNALLGWCEVTDCRRRSLLAYFDDSLTDDCGNCDVCLTPPEVFDGTEAAQKLLSTIYRTGQRFGAVYVIDVLMGKNNDKILRNGHESLSVFGIGSDYNQKQWRSILRQLVVQGFVSVDTAGYGGLQLNEQSRPLLRGNIELPLRRDLLDTQKKTKATRNAQFALADEDLDLFEGLRACRKRLAAEHNVPPYVIFHDKTLVQMAADKPQTEQELLAISGVGQTKLERFGADFLDVVSLIAR